MPARAPRRGGAARLLACAWLIAVACRGSDDPVRWAASIDGPGTAAPGSVVRVRIEARSGRGWYFYSPTQPAGGPVPARILLADSAFFRQAGPLEVPEPARSFDSVFGIDVEKFPGRASFTLPVRVPADAVDGRREIRVSALYQACNDTICLSPRTATLAVPVVIGSR